MLYVKTFRTPGDEESLQRLRRILRRLERQLQGHLEQDDACCGVSSAQCQALLEIDALGETTLTALAAALDLDISTLSRTVESLVQAGLVSRAAKAGNRRALRIALTSRGRRQADLINRRANAFFKKLFQLIPAHKHHLVIEGLGLLAESLLQTCPLCPASPPVKATAEKRQGAINER